MNNSVRDGISGSDAVNIATELGCKIEQIVESGEIRLSHSLIARSVKLKPDTAWAGRNAVSFLREVASLRQTYKGH